jgi:hypothetical protein
MATHADETPEPGWNWALRGRRDRSRIQGILDGTVFDGCPTWTERAGPAETPARTDPSPRRRPLPAIDAAVQRRLAAVPPGAVAPRAAPEEFRNLADVPPPNDGPFDDDLDPDSIRRILQTTIDVTEGVVLDGVRTRTEPKQMTCVFASLPGASAPVGRSTGSATPSRSPSAEIPQERDGLRAPSPARTIRGADPARPARSSRMPRPCRRPRNCNPNRGSGVMRSACGARFRRLFLGAPETSGASAARRLGRPDSAGATFVWAVIPEDPLRSGRGPRP